MKTTTYSSIPTLIIDYGKTNLPINNICYIESKFGNYSNIVLSQSKSHLTSFTLKRYCEELSSIDSFIQGSKGLLINLNHLKTIRTENDGLYALMSNGSKLKLSRRKGKELVHCLDGFQFYPPFIWLYFLFETRITKRLAYFVSIYSLVT